jgi:peptidoglycan/xylan/chitin deacetylase (PgdA/CDA1 family)
MPLWKQFLLQLYYHGTYPVRARHYWREVLRDHVPVSVLLYHRIADDRANPWTTSTRTFVRQIRWLSERFHLISLEEAQRRIRHGLNNEPCVSITFDDGYADNCRDAIPLLINERIPCTYFVTLHNVRAEQPFAHDLAMGNQFLPNSLEELRAMAAAGIEIGAHSYTHVDLGAVRDERLLHREIVTAGEELQAAIGRRVRYFAFPYGQPAQLQPAAIELARQSGYEGVCSAYNGTNYPGGDAFHLLRIPVDDNLISLKNRVIQDPWRRRTPASPYNGRNPTPTAANAEEVTRQK